MSDRPLPLTPEQQIRANLERAVHRQVADLKDRQKRARRNARHGAKHAAGMTRATVEARSSLGRKRAKAARKARRHNR